MHACMHALASESSICGCQVFGILQPAWSGRSSKICCLSINCWFNKKSEKILQGSYITSVSDQPFRWHRKLGGRGRMHLPLF